MKKIISLLLLVMLVFSLVGCGEEASQSNVTDNQDSSTGEKKQDSKKGSNGDKLVVWTFTDELQKIINNYYLKDNPDLGYEIEIVIVPTEQYQQKLDPVLGAGKSAPDVFALEAAFVKKYIDSGFTANLLDKGIEIPSDATVQYVLDVATDNNGALKGISWQATPGAFFYRRSLFEKYFGVSEPEDVQKLVSDFDKFYETAKEIKEKSNDETKLISSLGDIQNVYLAARKDGWIVDNKFVIDPAIDDLMELAKKLESENLTNEGQQWTETWFAAMSNDEVAGFFLPTWGLNYVLKSNAENANTGESTAGDWGVVQGPAPYFWGGTWLAMREGTKMEEAALDLIKYITLNEDFLTKYAKDTGDFLGHQKVVNNIKDDFSEEFLAGQNHYAQFFEMAPNIDATILTGSDQDINALLGEQLTAYAKGEKDKETAMKDFITAVQNAFPNLEY